MGWEAQAGAGVGFLAVGVMQGYKQVREHMLRDGRLPSRQGRRGHEVELYVVVVLALSHVVCDMIVRAMETEAMHPVAAAVNSQRLAVAVNFLLYGVVTLAVENTKVVPVPREVVSLLALSAFAQEFLLFYLQRDDAALEGQYHALLLVPIGACVVSTAAEIAYPRSVRPPLIRSMALVLQGTWFMQIAVSLFSQTWMSQGCTLKEEGEGDFTVTCEGMSLMRGQGIATLQFNCHLAMLLVLLLPLYSVMSRVYSSPRHYEPLGDSEGHYEAKELTQLKESSRISPRYAQADQFHVIQEDEELEEPTPRRTSADSNGFHTMVI